MVIKMTVSENPGHPSLQLCSAEPRKENNTMLAKIAQQYNKLTKHSTKEWTVGIFQTEYPEGCIGCIWFYILNDQEMSWGTRNFRWREISLHQGVYHILPLGVVFKYSLRSVLNTSPRECIEYSPVGVYQILSPREWIKNSIICCFKYSLWGVYQLLSLGSGQTLYCWSVLNTLPWDWIR